MHFRKLREVSLSLSLSPSHSLTHTHTHTHFLHISKTTWSAKHYLENMKHAAVCIHHHNNVNNVLNADSAFYKITFDDPMVVNQIIFFFLSVHPYRHILRQETSPHHVTTRHDKATTHRETHRPSTGRESTSCKLKSGLNADL